jgi:hypothetical protein
VDEVLDGVLELHVGDGPRRLRGVGRVPAGVEALAAVLHPRQRALGGRPLPVVHLLVGPWGAGLGLGRWHGRMGWRGMNECA